MNITTSNNTKLVGVQFIKHAWASFKLTFYVLYTEIIMPDKKNWKAYKLKISNVTKKKSAIEELAC